MTTPFSTAPGSNPFAVAVAPPSVFPNNTQLNGILLLLKPLKLEENLINTRYSKPGQAPQMYDRMTADLETIDAIPSGFDSNVFPGWYISGTRLIQQLRGNLATGQPVLGRLGLFKPGEAAGVGNPWGLVAPTTQDIELAMRYINGTHKPQPSVSPVPTQVVANGGFTVQNPAQAPAQQYAAQGQPLHQGTNPFA